MQCLNSSPNYIFTKVYKKNHTRKHMKIGSMTTVLRLENYTILFSQWI